MASAQPAEPQRELFAQLVPVDRGLAQQALQRPELATTVATLRARFDASRARGDTVHRREEARYRLAIAFRTQRKIDDVDAGCAQLRTDQADHARLVLVAHQQDVRAGMQYSARSYGHIFADNAKRSDLDAFIEASLKQGV